LRTSAERGSPALVLEGVAVAYGRHPAVEGVNGRVERGDSIALIGPNGAGKTTLIKAILGLAPLVQGRLEVLGGTPAGARGRVAYVPQADTLDPEFPVSALQVVLMGLYRRLGWLRRPGASARDAACSALDRVGMLARAHDRFGLLSGGQRQRVLLARAIAQDAELMLLDEPFNGLDVTTTDLLVRVLAELRGRGVAVVMATHDLSVAHLACGYACLLNRRQVAFGALDETLTPARLQETYGSRALVLAADGTVVTAR
jgi:manganese/iron transport system ATP-binding protein